MENNCCHLFDIRKYMSIHKYIYLETSIPNHAKILIPNHTELEFRLLLNILEKSNYNPTKEIEKKNPPKEIEKKVY